MHADVHSQFDPLRSISLPQRFREMKSTSLPLLIQSRPSIPPLPAERPSLPPGPINSAPTYDPSEIIAVGPPNISSFANNNAQTLAVINNVPKISDLPIFIYTRDIETGKLVRYLALDKRDLIYYTTDPDYGISQEWLLNNHQGDEYNRLPERIEHPEIAEHEKYNESGYTTLNRGRIWYGPPIERPYRSPYEEYLDLLEYAEMQEQEDDKS